MHYRLIYLIYFKPIYFNKERFNYFVLPISCKYINTKLLKNILLSEYGFFSRVS